MRLIYAGYTDSRRIFIYRKLWVTVLTGRSFSILGEDRVRPRNFGSVVLLPKVDCRSAIGSTYGCWWGRTRSCDLVVDVCLREIRGDLYRKLWKERKTVFFVSILYHASRKNSIKTNHINHIKFEPKMWFKIFVKNECITSL